MRIATLWALLLVTCCASTGCGKSLADLNRLAAAGSIQRDAPLQAELQVEIAASPATVWALLTDARSWPKWQPAIDSVTLDGPLQKGTRFAWKTGGITIHSQVQVLVPEREIGWTGSALFAKAIHIWELRDQAPRRTVVIVRESMDGPAIARLYSAQQLARSDRSWLLALKKTAEAHEANHAGSF